LKFLEDRAVAICALAAAGKFMGKEELPGWQRPVVSPFWGPKTTAPMPLTLKKSYFSRPLGLA
jgi:hypothetical protein